MPLEGAHLPTTTPTTITNKLYRHIKNMSIWDVNATFHNSIQHFFQIILSSNWSVQVCMVYNSTNANERAQLNQLPRKYIYIYMTPGPFFMARLMLHDCPDWYGYLCCQTSRPEKRWPEVKTKFPKFAQIRQIVKHGAFWFSRPLERKILNVASKGCSDSCKFCVAKTLC